MPQMEAPYSVPAGAEALAQSTKKPVKCGELEIEMLIDTTATMMINTTEAIIPQIP
jgi:hypothetical protein